MNTHAPDPLLKVRILWYGTLICSGIMLYQLFHLQIHLRDFFAQRSEKNFVRTEKIACPRGNILDRNGTLLATNRPITSLYWCGTGNKKISATQQDLLNHIIDIAALPHVDTQSILYAEKYYRNSLIARDLSFEQLSKIQEYVSEHDNIKIVTEFERLYPYGQLASHLLGYLGNIEHHQEGRMGLEKLCDQLLRGTEGSRLKIINSVGKALSETDLNRPHHGADIHSTLDLTLQSIIEKVFPTAHAGTFIILNPEDGAILALTSQPSFDPTMFLKPILTDEWNIIQERKQPFLNRAFSALYPPGSIFKLITLSAALEQELISMDTTIDCKGFYYFSNRKYWCHNRSGHGVLNAGEALEQSCNILCFEIGKHINIDTLADYAYRFGLGAKTNVFFNEKEGLIPTHDWKQHTKGERWWPGETLSASIGQSYILVTPIQVACMISSIFTGYLCKPRILTEEPIETKPLMIKPETLDFLRQSMKKVVTTGTGKRVSKVKDIEVYAKTSTAQNSALQKRHLGEEYLEHGWFVGYFKYKDHTPLTLVIMLENVGSSSNATNLARNFFIEYKKRVDQAKS